MPKPARRLSSPLTTTLPTKLLGRHRWSLSCVYPLTDTQAGAAAGGAEIVLDPDVLVVVPLVVCVDCNEPYMECRGYACEALDILGN